MLLSHCPGWMLLLLSVSEMTETKNLTKGFACVELLCHSYISILTVFALVRMSIFRLFRVFRIKRCV